MKIDRDIFIRIFKKIDNYEDVTENGFENEGCKIWSWEEETYILEKSTGIIVSWYKHLGRCNWCNRDLTIGQYEMFSQRILVYLEEDE